MVFDIWSLCLSDNFIYVASISLVEIFNFEFLIGKQHNFGSFWHICHTLEIQTLKPCVYVLVDICVIDPQWDHVFKALIFDTLLATLLKNLIGAHVNTIVSLAPSVKVLDVKG